VFLTAFFVYSANIGGLYIYSLDEAKNSECAREMLERGDLIVPTFNYELRTDKPPVHYYFMMLAYKLFGINEFSARFFSSVFGGLTVLITFLFARRYLGEKVAFLSFIVLISSLHTSIQFHMAVPDPYLIFWINASLFSFFVWYMERKGLFLYLFYLFMGLGVLTKGPVAVVLPVGIVGMFLLWERKVSLSFLKQLKPLVGILIVLFVSLPWYVAVALKTDMVWLKEFILKHNLHRFSAPMEGHGGIFLLTFAFVFVGLLPFSVFILQGLKEWLKERDKPVFRFLFLFATIYIIFFSISKTKLPNYTVPAYPPLAVILGYYLSKINTTPLRGNLVSVSVFIVISVALVVGLYIGLKNEPPVSDLAHSSLWFLILTAGGILTFVFFKRKQFTTGILTLSAFSVFMGFVFFYIAYPPIDRRNPVAQMLPLIEKDKSVAYYRSFNPAFVFYLRKRIPPLERERLKDYLSQSDRVYILTRKRWLKDFKGIQNAFVLKVVKDLFEKKVSALVSNGR